MRLVHIVYLLFLLVSMSAHAQDTQAPAPHMIFANKDSVYDFGGIPLGLAITYQFEVRNTGGAPLVISGMSCKSQNVVLKWPSKAMKPGKKGYIFVTYTAKGEVGSFDNDILITSNAWTGASPLIHITGAVTPEKGEYIPPPKANKKNQVRIEATPSPLVTKPE